MRGEGGEFFDVRAVLGRYLRFVAGSGRRQAEAPRGDAELAPEVFGEVALIREPGKAGHLVEGQVGFCQKALRPLHAPSQDVAVRAERSRS